MGRPDQSATMVTMIGVRNTSLTNKSFCIWVNELRASGFDQTSGEAAIGKLGLKLADLGTVQMNGSFKNYGFGGVQAKISERSRENNLEYGITANLNLDKLLPKNWGFKIPFFITYDRRNISPQFDPFDPDIFLSNSIQKFSSESKRQSYLTLVEDNTERKGFNFSNVKKLKSAQAKNSYPWDFSNFTFSYAYAEMLRTSPLIAEYSQLSHKGSLLYAFSSSSRYFEPFKKASFDLIKDFNLNLVPSSLLVR
jgi:cell surface protein SprA